MCNLTDKTALRRHFKELRAAIPDQSEKSRIIQEKVLTYSAIKQANSVFLYLSFGSEVETLFLAKELLAMGKRVAVPRCNPKTRTMVAVEIQDLAQLRTGAYGILEPDHHGTEIPKTELDVVLVPALAFDRDGFRLGYGGGYYDKFLADFSGKTIGLAFSDCVVDRLPRETFDLPVDTIITN